MCKNLKGINDFKGIAEGQKIRNIVRMKNDITENYLHSKAVIGKIGVYGHCEHLYNRSEQKWKVQCNFTLLLH